MNALEHKRELGILRNILLALAGACFLGQVWLDSSQDNLLCAVLCLVTFALGCFLLLHERNARGGAAFTAAAVFLSLASNSLIPLGGTLLEGHSLVNTLRSPVECYLHRLVFALALLAAHFGANSALGRPIKSKLGGVIDFTNLRAVLHPKQIWVLGACGIGLMVILKLGIFGDGALSKVFKGMSFLVFVPYILLVPPYLQATKQNKLWMLVLGLLYLVIIALGITSRMTMVAPIALVTTAFITAIITGNARISRIPPLVIFGAFVGIPIVIGQMMDLSTAILVERAHRDTQTLSENISGITDQFLDKERLREFKEGKLEELERIEARYGSFWKEDYLENPFLSRFTGIKSDDNLFTSSVDYSDSDVKTIQGVTHLKIVAQYPNPIIELLKLSVDKDFINSFSMGDLMDMLVNRNGFLGGFKTGSIVVHSYVVFGWWYPFFLALLFLVLFLIYQCVATPQGKSPWALGVSSFAMVYGFTFYLSFAAEGYHVVEAYLLRNSWQTFVLYALAVWFAKTVAPSPVRGRARKGNRSRHISGNQARRKGVQGEITSTSQDISVFSGDVTQPNTLPDHV